MKYNFKNLKSKRNVGEDVEKRELSCTVGGTINWCSLWKTVWRFLRKLKTELPYSPAMSLLVIYLKKTKTLIQKDL